MQAKEEKLIDTVIDQLELVQEQGDTHCYFVGTSEYEYLKEIERIMLEWYEAGCPQDGADHVCEQLKTLRQGDG